MDNPDERINPDRTATMEMEQPSIAELTRQLDIALHSPGRLAFTHRHAGMMYVRRHAPDLFREAMCYGYEQVSKDGCTYEDYVSRLEARIAAAETLMNSVRYHGMHFDECALCGGTHHQHARTCPIPQIETWQGQS